ncbi:MAG: hypothetical protein AAFR04_04005 [Pseudomonadota bacterium]
MKSKNRGGGKPQGQGAGSKRPYSTLNLKATEVKDGQGAGDDKAKSSGTASTTSTASSATAKSATPAGVGRAAGASAAGKSDAGAVKDAATRKGADTIAQAAKTTPTTSAASAAGAAAAGSKGASATASGGGAGGVGKGASTGGGGSGGSGGARPPATPAPRKSGGGFFSHAFASIVGAVLGVFGALYGANQLGLADLLPASFKSTDNTQSQQRFAALEKQLADLKGRAPGTGAGDPKIAEQIAAARARIKKLEALGDQITTLSAAQKKLAADTDAIKTGGGDSPSAKALNRLARLEQALKDLGDASKGDRGSITQLAGITGRVNDLESTLATQIAALRKDLIQEVDQRVKPATEASSAARSGAQRLDRDVTGLKSDSAKLTQLLETLRASLDKMRNRLKAVQDQTADLDGELKTLKTNVTTDLRKVTRPADLTSAIKPVTAKIQQLETNIKGVVRTETQRKQVAERIVLALELGNLKRAMNRGLAFDSELAEVKRVAGDSVDLKPLEAFKDKGVPTLGDLQTSFKPLTYQMIEAQPPQPNASFMDRMLSGAKSIVRVRKTDHAPGDTSTEAVVARMERALKDGRLSDVLAEAKKLKADARRPAEAWLEKVKARQSIDRALADIEAKLKRSLGGDSVEKG